jgi:hypothetical protein
LVLDEDPDPLIGLEIGQEAMDDGINTHDLGRRPARMGLADGFGEIHDDPMVTVVQDDPVPLGIRRQGRLKVWILGSRYEGRQDLLGQVRLVQGGDPPFFGHQTFTVGVRKEERDLVFGTGRGRGWGRRSRAWDRRDRLGGYGGSRTVHPYQESDSGCQDTHADP